MKTVTELLAATQRGEAKSASELLTLVYTDLRALAKAKMAREKPGQTLQPTALLHEAWLRIGGSTEGPVWQNRGHFYAAAAEAMRRILIERARRNLALRHGGGLMPVDVAEVEIAAPGREEELIAVDEALEAFSRDEPAKAELVKLRYFAGCTMEETAALLGLSLATAKRQWTYARAWLYRAMRRDADH